MRSVAVRTNAETSFLRVFIGCSPFRRDGPIGLLGMRTAYRGFRYAIAQGAFMHRSRSFFVVSLTLLALPLFADPTGKVAAVKKSITLAVPPAVKRALDTFDADK